MCAAVPLTSEEDVARRLDKTLDAMARRTCVLVMLAVSLISLHMQVSCHDASRLHIYSRLLNITVLLCQCCVPTSSIAMESS